MLIDTEAPAEYITRLAMPKDTKQITDVYNTAWKQLVKDLNFPLKEANIPLHTAIKATWVTTFKNQIVGFLLLEETRISKLYVHPDYQGKSVGASLFTKAVTQGATYLYVDEGNSKARRFYEKQGWVPTGNTTVGEIFPTVLLEYSPKQNK